MRLKRLTVLCTVVYFVHFLDLRESLVGCGAEEVEDDQDFSEENKHTLFGHLMNRWVGIEKSRSKSFSNFYPNIYRNSENEKVAPLKMQPMTIPIRSIGDFIFPSLERAVCGAWDSCVLRCGDTMLGAPYLCSCDANCELFKDCCVDHTYYCGNDTASNIPTQTELDGDWSEILENNGNGEGYDDDEFIPVFIGPDNEPEPESFIIEHLVKKAMSPGGGGKESLFECRGVRNNTYYGIWFFNNTKVNRKCLIKLPPWCDPNFDNGSVDLVWDFTQSLSILLNFGPPGWNNDLLFSQDYYNPDRCPKAWEIWDPFTQICRPVECNPDFVLEHGKCVWDGDGPSPPDGYALLGYKTKRANITFYGNILLPDSWSDLALPLLRHDIADTLSTRIRIHPGRISGATVVQDEIFPPKTTSTSTTTTTPATTEEALIGYPDPDTNISTPTKDGYPMWVLSEDGFPVTINMTLERKEENMTNELTVEQVLSVLHEAVTIRAVLRTLKGVPMKINGVEKSLQKEEIEFFEKWCRGGDLTSYWNEEFEVIFMLKNKTEAEGPGTKLEMAIQIKSTGVMYDEGQYVANLLYQSSDLDAEAANVSGVVLLCENRPNLLNNDCTKITLNETEFTIDSNGSLFYEGEIPGISSPLNRSSYEYTEDGEVKVCVDYNAAKAPLELPEPTLVEKIASIVCMVLIFVSLLGLLATLLTYALFPELRTLPGWCLIHLCLAEFAFYLLFVAGARRPTSEEDFACTLVAVSLHLTALLFFTWSSVISYDLFITFTKFQPVARSKEKYLWRYTVVGYGIPLFIIFSCIMVEFHTNHIISYGHHAVCWIGNSMASLYVFALPISISILLNATFFILTVRGIRRVAKSSTASNLRGNFHSKDKARFALYVRMSSLQCFAWIFGFLTVSTHFDPTLSTIFEFLFLILSSLQGMYIFLAFVWNKRVKRLYKSRAFCQDTRDLRRHQSSTVVSRMGNSYNNGSSNNRNNSRTEDTQAQSKDNDNYKENEKKAGVEKRRKLSGNSNLPAGRTVSNETCISIVSNMSDD